MSTPTITPAKKRGRPTVKITRIRQNISVSPDVIKKAKKLAWDEGLSLSTWIEQMVRTRIEEVRP
jgi:predicted HicB family RNase H-like nuclease